MKTIFLTFFAVSLVTSTLMAQSSENTYATVASLIDTIPQPKDCFTKVLARMLASNISSMEPGPEGYAYEFEKTLYEAACITKEDMESDEIIQKKLQAMWNRHKNEFLAPSTTLFSKGHVIKYAIRLGFSDFIAEVVLWNLSLDIDDGTGETILQYLEKEIKNPSNAGLQDDLNYYKRTLIKGMKAQELKID